MVVYVVIDRVDGIVEAVYKNKEDAERHVDEFSDSYYYDMVSHAMNVRDSYEGNK